MNLDEAQIATLHDDAFLGGDYPAEEPGQFGGPDCPFVVVAHHRGRALKLDAARWESRNQAVVDGHDESHVGMFLDISYLASGCPRGDVYGKGFIARGYRVLDPSSVRASLVDNR